jgi:hypothetical protein
MIRGLRLIREHPELILVATRELRFEIADNSLDLGEMQVCASIASDARPFYHKLAGLKPIHVRPLPHFSQKEIFQGL